MDKKLKTHIILILDKSTSMGADQMGRTSFEKIDATIISFNEQADQLKLNANDGHDLKCSLITFNGAVEEHFWGVNAEQLPKLDRDNYVPCGSTAMRDALGYAISKLLKEDDGETSYLVTTITDGDTNSDRVYSAAAISELRASCEKTGRYTFTYMGCTKEYVSKITKDLGFAYGNVAVFKNATPQATYASYAVNNAATGNYLRSRSAGLVACDNFYAGNTTSEDTDKGPTTDSTGS